MSGLPDAFLSCHDEHCVTCSDEGVAMRVLRVDDARGLALCEDAHGSRSSVEIALVSPIADGDDLLVHAGVAIAALADGEGTAARTAEARGRAHRGTVLAT